MRGATGVILAHLNQPIVNLNTLAGQRKAEAPRKIHSEDNREPNTGKADRHLQFSTEVAIYPN